MARVTLRDARRVVHVWRDDGHAWVRSGCGLSVCPYTWTTTRKPVTCLWCVARMSR